MGWKYDISPSGMVLYVLGMYPDSCHSVIDIQEKILRHFEYRIHINTIKKAIKEQDYVGGSIIESTERRGSLKIPTKVYTIQTITESS